MLYHYQVLKSDDGGVTNKIVYESYKVSKLAGGDGNTIWIYHNHEAVPSVILGPHQWTSVVRVGDGSDGAAPEVTD